MKLILLVTLSLSSSLAMAFDPDLATVKIQSGICNDPAQTLSPGSGLLFKYQNQVFVITSEHVVLQSNSAEICHAISNNQIASTPVTFLAANWGNGLALLATTFPYNTNIPTLTDFDSDQTTPEENVTPSGFPSDSTTLIKDKSAKIIASSSNRPVFPQINQIIEIKGHGEFGMSGGPLFNQQEDKIIGILSHQYLKPIEGQATEPTTYPAETIPLLSENILFAIPATKIKNWVESYFQEPAQLFLRDPNDQLQHIAIVNTNGCSFRLEDKITTPRTLRSPGGDGVGIGGEGNGEKTSASITLTLDETKTTLPFNIPSLSSWLEDVKTELRHLHEVEIPFLINGENIIYFNSLEQFFGELLRDNNTIPVALIPSTQDSRSEQRSELMESGKLLQEETANLLPDIDEAIKTATGRARKNKPGLIDAQQLLQQLNNMGTLLNSTAWVTIRQETMSDIEEHPGWTKLFNEHFREAVGLKTTLLKIKGLLSKLKIEREHRK